MMSPVTDEATLRIQESDAYTTQEMDPQLAALLCKPKKQKIHTEEAPPIRHPVLQPECICATLGPPNEFGVQMVQGFHLLPHQVDIVKWMIERERKIVQNPYFDKNSIGFLLAAYMGLGKSVCVGTLIVRTLITQREAQCPTLMVTAKSLLGSLEFELKKFFGHQLKILVFHRDFLGSVYDKFGSHEIRAYDVIITTYCTIESRFKAVENGDAIASEMCAFLWFRIILDESHIIRNRATQTFRAMNLLVSPIRICMTGTPIHNGIKDLFTQLEFCGLCIPKSIKKEPSLLKDFRILDMIKFVEQQTEIMLPLKRTHIVRFELSETERFLHHHFLSFAQMAFQQVRVNKSETHKNDNIKYLGETKSGLTRIMQVCTAPYLITKASKLDSGSEDMLQQEEHNSFPDNPVMDAWIRNRGSAAGLLSSKMRAFVKLVADTQRRKTIVFANLTSSLRLAIDSLVLACPAFKSHIVFVHGKVKNVSTREALFHRFRTDPECTHLFMTLKVGGVGFNLVEANVIIFLESWFNNAAHEQAESRAHRIGQKNPVDVYYLLAQNSIEEKIRSLAMHKRGIANECTALGAEHSRNLTAMDMEMLLC